MPPLADRITLCDREVRGERAPTRRSVRQPGASALLAIGADVGNLRAGLVSLVLRGWLV
jgi:hypothetical protein